MTRATSQKLADSGISISHTFEPGDLGRLIEIHGIQNYQDYGFSPIHEAYCAQIATEFMLNPNADAPRHGWRKRMGPLWDRSSFVSYRIISVRLDFLFRTNRCEVPALDVC